MNISVIGAGHIGLATALSFASKAHRVSCYDISERRIQLLSQGKPGHYEPGLQNLLAEQLAAQSIQFAHSPGSTAAAQSDLIFICVDTPNTDTGEANVSAIESVLKSLAESGHRCPPIVIKSTTPPGTNKKFSARFKNLLLVSSPEFLREGSALHDALHPSRLVVGCDREIEQVKKIFAELYRDFNLDQSRYLYMSSSSAEMCKYAANVFLAARISLINEFARLAESCGANIDSVQAALRLDERIGPEFLNSGLGYGGSCFPKDIESLLSYTKNIGLEMPITSAVQAVNHSQLDHFLKKILSHTEPSGGTVAILGLSFKPGTDDLREAPAIKLMQILIESGYNLKLYDPKAELNLQNQKIQICESAESALQNCQAVVFCTEWPEFYQLKPQQIKKHLKTPVVFDGRNIFDPAEMNKAGIIYYSVGRPTFK